MEFNYKKFLRSFINAFRGIRYAAREQNFRIQIIISIIVIFFAQYFDLRIWEKLVLVLIIVLILVLEILNTVFERVIDILEPRVHPYAKIIKDMMAAAVLISAIGAIVIAVIIFGPHLMNLL